jgi:hypothetical protein
VNTGRFHRNNPLADLGQRGALCRLLSRPQPVFQRVTLSCSISQLVFQGADVDVVFNVTATGDSLAYQWQRDGVYLEGAHRRGVGVDQRAARRQRPVSGQYTAVARNVLGFVASDSATLTVRPPPGSPQIEDFAQVSGIGISFLLNGDSGCIYTIVGSTNLTDWRVLTSLTNETGSLQVVLPDDLGQPMQFYRVRWSP